MSRREVCSAEEAGGTMPINAKDRSVIIVVAPCQGRDRPAWGRGMWSRDSPTIKIPPYKPWLQPGRNGWHTGLTRLTQPRVGMGGWHGRHMILLFPFHISVIFLLCVDTAFWFEIFPRDILSSGPRSSLMDLLLNTGSTRIAKFRSTPGALARFLVLAFGLECIHHWRSSLQPGAGR